MAVPKKRTSKSRKRMRRSHDHLKYFYAIVPPLCISWVEASLHAKDAMYKITRGASVREMYYADDGFAMGIAYCLAVLKQTNKYESFNWQESVKAYQKEEMKKVDPALKTKLSKMQDEFADLLDEATAAAEAMTLCYRQSKVKSNRFFVDINLHPQSIAILKTRAEPLGINLTIGDILFMDDNDYFGCVIQI